MELILKQDVENLGFKDDIVVRVQETPNANEVRIDIRSKSRVGQSDLVPLVFVVHGLIEAVQSLE